VAAHRRRRRWSFANAASSPFELWVGIVAMVNVVGFLTKPDANPIHLLVAPLDAVWACTYGVAGALLFVGLVRDRSSHLEAIGLALLLGGILVQLIVFGTLGVTSLNGTWGTIVSLSALGVIAVWRMQILLSSSRRLKRLDKATE
jgi:hypothetical protein